MSTSLIKSVFILLLASLVCGCGSSSSTDESSRTVDNGAVDSSGVPGIGSAQSLPGAGGDVSGSAGSGNDTDNMAVVEIGDLYIDPTSSAFIESESQHFENALKGAWIATECKQVESQFTQSESKKAVFVFSDTELVESEYTYNSTDCSGSPSSKWYPLPVRTWSLGEYRTLLDGSGAWELDTSIIQRGVYAGDIDDDVGSRSYVNIGFVEGMLEFNALVENYAHTRPTVRGARFFESLQGRGLSTIDSNALLGQWRAPCTGRLESTYEFFPDSLVITDENWADVGCEGDSYAIRRSTFNLVYGEPFTSIFKDRLIAITLSAVSNELVKFDDSQGLDKPEFKVPEGKTEYRAVSIDNNTLILAYCLYRNSGEDDCQDSDDRTPDMVDHNWGVRFNKVL